MVAGSRESRVDTQRTIAVVGGGTGGHIYPALAVVEEILTQRIVADRDRVFWIGSKNGPEAGIVRDRGVRFYGIQTGKLRRYLSFKNITDVARIAFGFGQAYRVLRRERPAVLFAKGGYVSVPPVLAARVLGIPVVCHESDLDPGLATRINSRFSRRVLVPYDASTRYYPDRVAPRVVVTGVPVRPDLFEASRGRGRSLIGAPADRPVLLVIGGSQGARALNAWLDRDRSRVCRSWYVVHQTGRSYPESERLPGYFRIPYLREEYCDVLAAADCIVCRAGATTLWEAANLGKCMVLVPLGLDASRGDQIRNARYFGEEGAAVVADSAPIDESRLLTILEKLAATGDVREGYGRVARNLVTSDASAKIAQALLGVMIEEEARA